MYLYFKLFFFILVFFAATQEGKANCYNDIKKLLFVTAKPWRALRAKMPFVYIDPLPSIARKLNINVLEKKRNEYLALLSESFEISISPKTKEEIFALIDAVKNKVSQKPIMSTNDFKALVNRQEREFVRLLRKWKPHKRKISPEKFRQFVNIYHLSLYEPFFSWKNIGGTFYPQDNLQKLTKMRLEQEMLKTRMFTILRGLNVVSSDEYTVHTYIDAGKFLLRGFIYGYLNYGMISVFNIPYGLPRTDRLYNFIETIKPFFDVERLYKNQQNIEGVVFYGRWARNIYFVVVMPYITVEAYQDSMGFLEEQLKSIVEEPLQQSEPIKILTKEDLINQILDKIHFQWREHYSTEMPSNTKGLIRKKLESLNARELIGIQYALEMGNWKRILGEFLSETN